MRLDEITMILLEGFTLQAPCSGKVGLEMVHELCGDHVCDAETTDSLAVLAHIAGSHLVDCSAFAHHQTAVETVRMFAPPF